MSPADVSVLREIAPGARVAPDAVLGAFSCVGPEAAVGPRTRVGSRVTIVGHTTIGSDNVIQDGCVLGALPQDLKYRGRKTYLFIGDRNHFAPNVTAHVGTELGGYVTAIGSDNVLATGAHVAHDCYVDDWTHLGAGVLLAGHIRVETGAVLEDMTGVTHFATIGRFSRVGACTPVTRDVPPFTYFVSRDCYTWATAVHGVNEPGLAEAGLSVTEAEDVRRAVGHLFKGKRTLASKVRAMLDGPVQTEAVRELLEFCRRRLSHPSGLYRETFRGKMPPEAGRHLPPDVLTAIQGGPPP